jgi:hypothetical protein
LSITSPLNPLASNDLFGGAHLGQHAERIQAAKPCKHRRQLLAAQVRKAACTEMRSDSTRPPTQTAFGRNGLNHATFAMRNHFPNED